MNLDVCENDFLELHESIWNLLRSCNSYNFENENAITVTTNKRPWTLGKDPKSTLILFLTIGMDNYKYSHVDVESKSLIFERVYSVSNGIIERAILSSDIFHKVKIFVKRNVESWKFDHWTVQFLQNAD